MNKYEVICQIGSGSYGRVYKIIRKSDGKELIWKEMRLEGIPQDGRKLIENEISILRELDHPNIVKQYETFTDDLNSKLYIVMEYCEKGDLDKLILQNKNNNKFVDEDLIWDILVQTLNALKYIHNEKKILHRDIKPSNIFLDKYYKIKLGDFGLSRKYYTGYANTILGTPLYMAPEMLEKKQYNVEADIWALGCSIYELTNYVVPFEAPNMDILLNIIRSGPPKRINFIYSEHLWNIVSNMLIADYRKRPSASELLEKCNQIVSIRNNMFNIKNRNEIQAKWEQMILYDLKLQMMEKQVNERGQKINIEDKKLKEREQKVLEKEKCIKVMDEMLRKNLELNQKNKISNLNAFNNNNYNIKNNEKNKNEIYIGNNNDYLNEKINQNNGFINNQSVNENKNNVDTNEDGVLNEIQTNNNNNLTCNGNNNNDNFFNNQNNFNNNNNINGSKINNNYNNNNQKSINDNYNSNENNNRINSNYNHNNKELNLGDTYKNIQKFGQYTQRDNKIKLNDNYLNNTMITKKDDNDPNKNKIINNKNNTNDINNNNCNNINNNKDNNIIYNNINNNHMINNNNGIINNNLNNNQMINNNNINNNIFNNFYNNQMINNNNNGIINNNLNNNQMINNNNINNNIYNNSNNNKMINNNNINNLNNINQMTNYNNNNYNNNNLNNNNMINCNNSNSNNNNNQNELKNNIVNKNDNEKKENLTQYSFYKNNKKFPKIGLINFGDTSYLNVVIQSLVNIEDLALYFLDSDKMNYLDSVKNELPLSYEIKEIFCHLYPPKEESIENSYAPLSLLEYFIKDKKYTYDKSSNPIYLIKDLLNGLDSELNSLCSNNVEDNENKSDREVTIYSEMNYILKTNDSPIFRIFCFTKTHESICEKYCNIYDLKKYNTFNLNISRYYSSKKEKVTIKDLIRSQYEEPEKTKLLICPNCHRRQKVFVYSKIYSSPNIFLFLIDRGSDFNQNKNKLLTIPLIIEDQLDLDNFIENKDNPTKYELIGIVSILIKDKKYVSMCKSPIDNNWYYYNDEEIEKIEHKKLIELCNNYNMYSSCIVIYKAANQNNK